MTINRYYTEGTLGPRRSLTPEGFLICHDVALARTGSLLYAPGEVPIDAGKDGIIGITRDPDDVFHPDSIASFEGKPVTNDHPPLGIKVDPTNWRQLAVGDVHNVRRGDGAILDDQYLYGDLIIKDAAAIQDVLDGKREVSAGYDAEYEQLEPGRGRQHDIIGNHVALVDRGRCGPNCSIGDSDTMAAKKASFSDRIKAAFYSRDESALVSELAKVPDMMGDIVSDDMPPGMNIHFHGGGGAPSMPSAKGPMSVAQDEGEGAVAAPAAAKPAVGAAAEGGEQMPPWAAQLMQRIETMEQAIMLLAQDESDEGEEQAAPPAASEEDAPGKVEDDASEIEGEEKKWPAAHAGSTEDRRRRAAVGDSTSLAPAFQDMLARAAVLCPTIKLPTFDSSRGAKMTVDSMCNFRRTTLAKAWATSDGREVIGSLYQAPRGRNADFSRDAMTCDAATLLFNGASELVKRSNTQDGQRKFAAVMDHGREVQGPTMKIPTISEINANNAKIWAAKTAATPVR